MIQHCKMYFTFCLVGFLIIFASMSITMLIASFIYSVSNDMTTTIVLTCIIVGSLYFSIIFRCMKMSYRESTQYTNETTITEPDHVTIVVPKVEHKREIVQPKKCTKNDIDVFMTVDL